jgi:hypothetical protein
MRIGFDLDGVLADLHSAYARVALRLFPELDPSAIASADAGSSPPPAEEDATDPEDDVDTGISLALSRQQNSQVWDELAQMVDFWETLDETEPGIVARVASVAEDRRWEVMFLTSRPLAPGRTVQRQSQRWLERLGFPLPSVYVVHGSRGKIADALALDVVVDDRPENCLDVVLESKARAILVWRGTAASVPGSAKRLSIGVQPTVAACLDVLVEAERAAETPSDLMHRLRRLLGLAPKASSPK